MLKGTTVIGMEPAHSWTSIIDLGYSILMALHFYLNTKAKLAEDQASFFVLK